MTFFFIPKDKYSSGDFEHLSNLFAADRETENVDISFKSVAKWRKNSNGSTVSVELRNGNWCNYRFFSKIEYFHVYFKKDEDSFDKFPFQLTKKIYTYLMMMMHTMA